MFKKFLTVISTALLIVNHATALEVIAVTDSKVAAKVDARIADMQSAITALSTHLKQILDCNNNGMLVVDGVCQPIPESTTGGSSVTDPSLTIGGQNGQGQPKCKPSENLAQTAQGWICLSNSNLPEPPACYDDNTFLQWNGQTWNCISVDIKELETSAPPICTGENKFLQWDGSRYTCADAKINNGGGTNGSHNGAYNNDSRKNRHGPAVGQCTARKKNNAWSCTDSGSARCVNQKGCVCSKAHSVKRVTGTATIKRYTCH